MSNENLRKLIDCIDHSPTAFHAVATAEEILLQNGFSRLDESSVEALTKGGKYFITRNNSSIIAFTLPESAPTGLMICASHSDSPCFKVKPNAELETVGQYVRLNTERYGGMIMPSWFDRPLSLAGRIAVETEDGIEMRLVNIDRDLLVIPNVAIHMSNTNNGYNYNAKTDMVPLMADISSHTKVVDLVAKESGIEADRIIGHDLFLYCRQKGSVVGADEAFFLSPRIDNLECAFTSLFGFLDAKPTSAVPMFAVFDNEETGSQTKQGAASDFLTLVIDRILAAFSASEQKAAFLANSFMLSADNAHAMHPNHPELADNKNTPRMNSGIVIKYNASQRYTTDGVSAALFKKICQKENVPTQVFANRSDMAGGSTLGSIATTKVSIKTVDIGLAQLAMHSACEIAGVSDVEHMINACRVFFSTALISENNRITLK
ncbi:MAG: M18 family aminopeptidase [Clostridia bacterium]|nr:M18 family aminopeptidase [Clostridia bacterium]